MCQIKGMAIPDLAWNIMDMTVDLVKNQVSVRSMATGTPGV